MPQAILPARVLIVDDDDMSRELLSALLEEEGMAVQSAESGVAALQLVKANSFQPSVVLTDMQMPGMTPDELAGLLRTACSAETVLLAMSGSIPSPAIQACFDGFLLKPFTVEDFTAALATARSASPAKKSGSARHAARASLPQSGSISLAASAGESASEQKMNVEAAGTPAPAASRKTSILNEEIYRQLAGSMPREQLHEMYRMCLTDARKRIASMRISAAAADGLQFVRQAHAIKGSSGMLGATELHHLASALEDCGLDSAQGSVNSLDELASSCDRLERMLGARA